ncbi:hypothetical protein GLAREA_03940 [Glarea lozoyensis ATCC 20868]|uniref:Uncharacterized protein n=1 Tax=Glarea lozoyensis (strain ATCC 20868 / MF5171) TaxID=1116229 RepID=S3DX64_GLAL2|nr:uncharacterized protein GLAREA_03940 [Glarea lozoyensis ATCC 20868]EPE30973.1 hypothetical protein GLAREA_03940 [Glarea lozoyensis ATCC 20868]
MSTKGCLSTSASPFSAEKDVCPVAPAMEGSGGYNYTRGSVADVGFRYQSPQGASASSGQGILAGFVAGGHEIRPAPFHQACIHPKRGSTAGKGEAGAKNGLAFFPNTPTSPSASVPNSAPKITIGAEFYNTPPSSAPTVAPDSRPLPPAPYPSPSALPPPPSPEFRPLSPSDYPRAPPPSLAAPSPEYSPASPVWPPPSSPPMPALSALPVIHVTATAEPFNTALEMGMLNSGFDGELPIAGTSQGLVERCRAWLL